MEFTSPFTRGKIRPLIISLIVLLLLAQGASAGLYVNSTDKFIEKDGVKTFMFGTGSPCIRSDFNGTGQTCAQSLANLTDIDYVNFEHYGSWLNGSDDGVNNNDNLLNASGIYFFGYAQDSPVINNTPGSVGYYWRKNLTKYGGTIPMNEPDYNDIPYSTVQTQYNNVKAREPNNTGFLFFMTLMGDWNADGQVTYWKSLGDVFNVDKWHRYDNVDYKATEYLYSIESRSQQWGLAGIGNIETWDKPILGFAHTNGNTAYNGYKDTNATIRSQTYLWVAMGVKGMTTFGDKDSYNSWGGMWSNKSMLTYVNQLARELHSFNWIFINSTSKSWGDVTKSNINTTGVTFTNNSNYYYANTNWNVKHFNYMLKVKNSTTAYLVVVNKDMNQTTTQINVTDLAGTGTRYAKTIGLELEGSAAIGKNLTVTNGVFTDTFDGYAAHVYEISNTTSGGESGGSGIPANQYIINASGGNATWSDFTLTNAVIRGNRYVTNDLAVQGYTSWWDGKTNNTGSTAIWDSNRTTANTGTLAATSLWNSSGGWNFQGNNQYMTASSSVVNRTAGSIFFKFLEITGKGAYAGIYSAGDTKNQLYRSNSDTSLKSSFNGVDQIHTVSDIWDNASHNFLYTWNDTSNVRSIHIDGTVNTSTVAFSLPASMDTLYVGAHPDGLHPLGGNIKYMMIYPMEVTESQRYSLYNHTYVTTSNITTLKNWTDGNVTYQVVVNATTPANTNYSVWYRQNATGDYVLLNLSLTGNNTISITTQYQNTDVRIQLFGNETATPELMEITYYSQSSSESESTAWTTGIGGVYFQNQTIGSNRTCINTGDGSIEVGYVCDNFNDNNTNGWNETGDLSTNWVINNGTINQTSAAVSGYLYQNVTSYQNMSIFTKFKEYNNLNTYIDASDLRGNLSRLNANSSWLNCQFSIGSPTGIRAYIYCYNGSSWLPVNESATKTRYLNEWNYAGFFANGTTFKGYLSNVSYANAMTSVLSSGTSSQWLNGTTIQFGAGMNASAILSWDEIRAVELDAQGNQYLQGNYTMNYTVPGGQYTKNITINGSYPTGTNYTVKYRQNATGDYIAVEGVKTTDSIIELPTPYYQNIDIKLEMNASISDTLSINNIDIGASETDGQTAESISLTRTSWSWYE
jgi:hypothetical protein